jgi:hypothetical protein
VRVALKMMFYGLLVYFICTTAQVGIAFVLLWSSDEAEIRQSPVMGHLGLVSLAAGLVVVVGRGLCVTIPAQSRLRQTAISSFVSWCLGVAIGFGLVLLISQTRDTTGSHVVPTAIVMALAAVLFVVIGDCLFITFLQGVGRCFGDSLLSEAARSFLVAYLTTAIAGILGFFLVFLLAQTTEGWHVLLSVYALIVLTAGMILMSWQLKLLKDTSDTIG